MELTLQNYALAIVSLGAMATLLLVQTLVADAVAIRARHVPGTPPEPNPWNALFRVSRTVANANETIAVYICALLFCLLTAASPWYTALWAWAYVGTRFVYAICYYANWATARSICFALSVVTLIGLISLGFLA